MNAVLARHGVQGADGMDIQRQFWQQCERQLSEDWSVEPQWQPILEGLLSAEDFQYDPTILEELWRESYLGHKFFGTKLYPDTLPTLQWAKDRGLRLGLLSQRPFGGDFLRRDLEELKIADFFDVTLATADVGLRKLHPEPFLQVAAVLNVAPAEVAMIGDMLETDLVGAERAGMVTVWLNRGGRSSGGWDPHYPKVEISPDYTIQSLDQLRDHELSKPSPKEER